jgi:sodium pump decarboxylase gamma subunit
MILEKLIIGVQITVIGMTVVFFILILISVALNLMHVLITRMDKAETKRGTSKTAAHGSVEKVPEDHAQLIAVLMAAAMAADGAENPIRALTIRPVSNRGLVWKDAARASLMTGFNMEPRKKLIL